MSLWTKFWNWFDATFYYGFNGFDNEMEEDDGEA